MKCLEWNIYTYRHRRAFEYCVHRLIREPTLRQEMLRRAAVHDMDKMIMYLFMDQQTAQRLHVSTKPHHLENDLPKSREDLVEAVIDYECAPYTKPDKPLNAYDFVHLLMDRKFLDEATGRQMIEIMAELGIAKSARAADDVEGMAYIASIGEVTEEMIYAEILRYVRDHPDNELEEILRYINLPKP